MNKGIKGLVSKQKRRYQEGGYDLDLSYITDRIIAMGFPAQHLEGVYRNHIDDVQRFLEEKHKDHYKIYNLCCERSYDESRFHNRVRRFYFADHNPPPLNEIRPLCDDISKWLKEESSNVAVVHCKAGKGRTGVMICCYMIHSKFKLNAKEALDFYDEKRTLDRKGVTIPSQRRYVEYYAKLAASGFKYNPVYVRLKEARMQSPLSNTNSEIYVTISSHGQKGYSSQMSELRKGVDHILLRVKEEEARPFRGDIKIELHRTNLVRRKEKLFSAWLNTHFLYEEGKNMTNGVDSHLGICKNSSDKQWQMRQSTCSSTSSNSGSIETPFPPELQIVSILSKSQLDKANKDSHHKLLPKEFQIELHWLVNCHFEQRGSLSENMKLETRLSPSILTPSATSSDEEEDDDDDDDDNNTDWESDGHCPERYVGRYRLMSNCSSLLAEGAPT